MSEPDTDLPVGGEFGYSRAAELMALWRADPEAAHRELFALYGAGTTGMWIAAGLLAHLGQLEQVIADAAGLNVDQVHASIEETALLARATGVFSS